MHKSMLYEIQGPTFLPRLVDGKLDESFCKQKHKERPNYKLLNEFKVEAKKHYMYAHMFAICQECEPEPDEDDHFDIDGTPSFPRDGYISGMAEEAMMSSPMHTGSTSLVLGTATVICGIIKIHVMDSKRVYLITG